MRDRAGVDAADRRRGNGDLDTRVRERAELRGPGARPWSTSGGCRRAYGLRATAAYRNRELSSSADSGSSAPHSPM